MDQWQTTNQACQGLVFASWVETDDGKWASWLLNSRGSTVEVTGGGALSKQNIHVFVICLVTNRVQIYLVSCTFKKAGLIVWVCRCSALMVDEMESVWRSTHLHGGQIAAVSPGEPASAGALINIHILQVDINLHHAPTHTHTHHTVCYQLCFMWWNINIQIIYVMIHFSEMVWVSRYIIINVFFLITITNRSFQFLNVLLFWHFYKFFLFFQNS